MKICSDDVALHCSVYSPSAWQRGNGRCIQTLPSVNFCAFQTNMHLASPSIALITTFFTGLHLLGTWELFGYKTFNVSYVFKKVTKVLNLLHHYIYTCHASSKQKAFRVLDNVFSVLDYASNVWNPHTNKEFKTVVLAGFVEADFVLVPIDGLNHLKSVVQSYFDHHSLLEESICL